MEQSRLSPTQDGAVMFVDDDADASSSLIKLLKGLGLRAKCDAYTSAARAVEAIKQQRAVEVAIIDLSLEPLRGVESGFALLREVLQISPITRVIVLTGHGSEEYGIRALQLGAANFLEKPASPAHLLALINDGIGQSKLLRSFRERASASHDIDGIFLGDSEHAVTLRHELDFLSSNTLSVFLRGETGVGKSFFAWRLHQLALASGHITGNFVSYAPRAGGNDLISSDLFGHAKGAFTGATEKKSGLLQHANGGTLFLDEVDELPADVQVTLLTVLQNRSFRPLGSTQEESFTGRVISASNGDYEESQRSGKLRSDLFHRLAQEIVTLAPLRKRQSDIPQLAAFFLQSTTRRVGSAILGFEPEALAALSQYSWPGNIRELEKAVERGAARAAFERQVLVRLSDLPVAVQAAGSSLSSSSSNSFSDQVEEYKIKLIEEALARHGGNQLKAAESLELDRSSMRRILARKKQ